MIRNTKKKIKYRKRRRTIRKIKKNIILFDASKIHPASIL